MLVTFLTIVHVLVCLFLIVVVLLQSGKAADLAGAFGGMGSQTAFGPRGSATLLSKATTGSAILFMVTSLALSIAETRSAGGGRTVFDKEKSAPATAGKTPGVVPAPVSPAGQPSVTLTDEGTGATTTVPITIPPNPNAPPQQAPAKK